MRLTNRPPTENGPVHNALAALRVKNQLVKSIAAQIAIPHDYAPVKINSGYSSVKIAAASPHQTTTDDWTNAAHPTPAGMYLVANEPYCTGISAYYPTVGETSHYFCMFCSPDVTDAPGTTESQEMYISSLDKTVELASVYWVHSTGTALHGPGQMCFTKNGISGTLFSKDTVVTFAILNGGVHSYFPVGVNVVAQTYRSGNWQTVSTVPVYTGVGVMTWTAPYAGIFSFKIINPPTTTENWTILMAYDMHSPSAAPDSHVWWAQDALPLVSSVADGVTGMLVSGSSLCATPAASVLDKAGAVAIGYFSAGMDIATFVNTGTTDLQNLVTTTSQGVSLSYEGGAYTFWRPNRIEDFTLRPLDWVNYTTGNVVGTTLDPDLLSGFSVVVLTGPKNSLVHRVTRSYSVCFSTVSTWFDVQPPIRDDESLRLACDILSTLPAGYENPFHWSDITNFIKKAAGTLLRFAPSVLDAVGGAAPELAPFTAPLSAIARSAPVQAAARGLRAARCSVVETTKPQDDEPEHVTVPLTPGAQPLQLRSRSTTSTRS